MTDSGKKQTKPKKVYRAVVGLTLKDGSRAEPGDIVVKPPEWLIAQGKVAVDGS